MTPISIIANGSFCLGRGIDQRITFADSIARYNYVWKRTTRRSYFSIKIYRPKFKFKKKKECFVSRRKTFFHKILYIYICFKLSRITTRIRLPNEWLPKGNCNLSFLEPITILDSRLFTKDQSLLAHLEEEIVQVTGKWKFSSRSKDSSGCGGIHLERLGIPVETTVNKS